LAASPAVVLDGNGHAPGGRPLRKPTLSVAIFAMIASAASVEAQEMVFVIRHAEKHGTGDDPGLTDAGRARANAWADLLSHADIAHVITTDAKRTRETGGIIAEALDVAQTQVAMTDVTGLVDLLGFDHADDRVLVVGHTETIPSILAGLGHLDLVEIDQNDYANLFIVMPASGGDQFLTHIRMPELTLP
jgi:broad specificity phosphatase PhoE